MLKICMTRKWFNLCLGFVLVCSTAGELSEEVKDEIHIGSHIYTPEDCAKPMGFENHQLPDTMISVSSYELNSGPSRIRLNTHREGEKTGGWIPKISDYIPEVLIDFDGERNLTGILTQGLEDDDLWVFSYRVLYSLDNKTWENAADMETNNTVFPGNSDRNTVVLKLFSKMITARFLKIIILDYHIHPALRMEVYGCFIPYTIYTINPFLQTTTELCVEYGPWVSLSDPTSGLGDEENISEIIASSGVCRNPIDIECRTLISRKDYTQTGQKVICNLEQGLLCKNERQSSYQCYNYEVRIICWSCGATTVETLLPLVLCPEVPEIYKSSCPPSCPHDYACDGTECVPTPDCPCFQDGKRFEPSNIKITKDCNRCECILGGYSTCEPIQCAACLPEQKSEMDLNCQCHCVGCPEGTLRCPTSGECVREDEWCNGVEDCPDDEKDCPIKEVNCPDPGVSIDGNREGSCCLIGDLLRYSCNEDYELVGPGVLECLPIGNWTFGRPLCRPLTNHCILPPAISHGVVEGSKDGDYYLPYDAAVFICDTGYSHPQEKSLIECNEEGEWEAEFEECTEILCDPPDPIKNGVIKELLLTNLTRFPFHFDLTYVCDKGFRLMGENSWRLCESFGWSGMTPYCEEIRCGAPITFENGTIIELQFITLTSFPLNFELTYICDKGFRLVGGDSWRFCDVVGWSGKTPHCEEIHCDPPEPFRNGTIRELQFTNRTSFPLNFVLTYFCDQGFRLIGGNSWRFCDSNGWTGKTPQCEMPKLGSYLN